MELSNLEVSGLAGLIVKHQSVRKEINYISEDDALFSAVAKAEKIYNDILDFKVTALTIGREKAKYLLSLIEEDCPQKEQVRRFLEAMV